MNVWKKILNSSIFIITIMLIIATFFFYLTGRRNNVKAAEVKEQLDISAFTISGLKLTIEDQRQTYIALIDQRDKDRKTISELRETSRRLGAFVINQRNIIREITSGDNAIRKSSGTITIRLEDSIKEVDELIEFFKNRED